MLARPLHQETPACCFDSGASTPSSSRCLILSAECERGRNRGWTHTTEEETWPVVTAQQKGKQWSRAMVCVCVCAESRGQGCFAFIHNSWCQTPTDGHWSKVKSMYFSVVTRICELIRFYSSICPTLQARRATLVTMTLLWSLWSHKTWDTLHWPSYALAPTVTAYSQSYC